MLLVPWRWIVLQRHHAVLHTCTLALMRTHKIYEYILAQHLHEHSLCFSTTTLAVRTQAASMAQTSLLYQEYSYILAGPSVQGLKSAYSHSVHLLLSLLRTASKIKMSWQRVFVIGNISRRVCGLHLCQGVPRISLRPIKPLHMRNEDCHASSYSCLSIFPAALYHSRGQAL